MLQWGLQRDRRPSPNLKGALSSRGGRCGPWERAEEEGPGDGVSQGKRKWVPHMGGAQ